MTFDSEKGHVKTHFNDQLVVLLREVRVWVAWMSLMSAFIIISSDCAWKQVPCYFCPACCCLSYPALALLTCANPRNVTPQKARPHTCFLSHILLCVAHMFNVTQVRQLQSLGFSIKKNILNEVETANRFYRYRTSWMEM
jgi:hypothetical protein